MLLFLVTVPEHIFIKRRRKKVYRPETLWSRVEAQESASQKKSPNKKLDGPNINMGNNLQTFVFMPIQKKKSLF